MFAAKKKLHKIRFPIAFKLAAVTIVLLFAVTALIAWKSSKFFEQEIRETHEQSTQIQAANRATEAESLFQSYVDKIRMVASLMTKGYASPAERAESLVLTFKSDKDLISIEIYQEEEGQIKLLDSAINTDYLDSYGISAGDLQEIHALKPFPLNTLFGGKIEVRNSSIGKGAPILTVGIPYIRDSNSRITHVVRADIRLDRLQKIFSASGATDIFLLDQNGNILAHPEESLAMRGAKISDSPLVSLALTSEFKSNHLPLFVQPDTKKSFYGVFNRTSFGPTVVAQIPLDIIQEPSRQVRREAFYIGGIVLSVALFIIFVFSISLTNPIDKLLALTEMISKGNFDIHAQDKIRSRDEVGDLAQAFDQMTLGLKALVKTQGADVAQTLMESDLENLGGTKKMVTVLFSDLRDFTKFSEGHSPEEVVEMLNEYFEVMVGCIERNQGRVNKFIGDAIMAMWGAPHATENDEERAVNAALEMRIELNKLNDLRISRGEPPIKIGVGLHCGEAVAGTIGSKSRLEYTIIGDTVNQSSRLEASTKAFGVDIILSEELANKTKEKFSSSYAGSAEVKGKAEPLRMYKINGRFDETGKEILIKTPYSEYQAEKVDKISVAS